MAETFTPNYQLSMFAQGDNPGAHKLNANWENIDEIMADAAAGIATLEEPSYITFANEASLPNSKRLTGLSPNQVIVSDGGSDVFLSLPQNIHSAADVTFTSLTLNGGLSTPFISMSGYMEFTPDNTHDLTLVGARPRDVFVGRNLAVGGYANVGTTTDAAAAGDFAAGLAASHRAFYDQSTATLKLHSEAASNIFSMNSSNVQVNDIRFLVGDVLRWIVRANNTAESGSNVGTDFTILARSDAGAALFTPLFIKRSTGFVGIGSGSVTQQLDVAGGIAANGTIATASGSSAVVLGKANAIPTNEAPAHILWADSGTGLVAGSLALVARSSAAASIALYTGTTSPALRWQISSDGHWLAGAHNTYDWGSGAADPRTIYAGTSFSAADGTVSLPSYAFSGVGAMGAFRSANILGIVSPSQTSFYIGTTGELTILSNTLRVSSDFTMGFASGDAVNTGVDTSMTRGEAGCVRHVDTRTITGAVTDGYTGAIRLSPAYSAATAQTVTRHNYIDLEDAVLSGAGPAALTDACVFRLNAALGTHKATTALDKTANAKDGTLKVNVNGTIKHIQLYAN